MYFKTCCWELRTYFPKATMLQIHGVLSFLASEKNCSNPENGTTGEFTAQWNLNIMYTISLLVENGFCLTNWHTSAPSPQLLPLPPKKPPVSQKWKRNSLFLCAVCEQELPSVEQLERHILEGSEKDCQRGQFPSLGPSAQQAFKVN